MGPFARFFAANKNYLHIFALILLSLAALAQPAGAAPCMRPAAGSIVSAPPDLYSTDGVLKVTFKYETATDAFGHALYCFVTPSGLQSPTLHVKPGERIRIAFVNMLPAPAKSEPLHVMSDASTKCGALAMTPASANIHFHGTNTPPTCHSDEVIHTLINAGESFTYDLKIPADEPPGLYWYHPHVHGISEAALQGGASGAIEIEGIAAISPAVKGLPERYLVIRDQLVSHAASKTVPLPAWDVSLNYVPILYPAYAPAILRMRAGGREFWRVVNASADTMIDLELLYGGKAQPLALVAHDGVAIGSQDGARKGTTQTATHILLPPAGRAEFIVTGPPLTIRSAMLVTRAVNTGPAGDIDPERPLAHIAPVLALTGTPHALLAEGPANPQRFEGLAQAMPSATRRLYFSEVVTPPPDRRIRSGGHAKWGEAGSAKFYITVQGANPTLFNPLNPPAITTTQGSVEDWTIENRTGEIHAFHMHQIHFLLLAVSGVPVSKSQQQFYDTYPIGYWKGGAYPSITVRMDFRGPIAGDFVYHCHILEHEDAGMMAIIRVLPKSAARDRDEVPAWRRAFDIVLHRLADWKILPAPPQRPVTRLADAATRWTFPARCLHRTAR